MENLNEVQITITDAKQAMQMVQDTPGTYRVISISSPYNKTEISGAKEILCFQFYDMPASIVEHISDKNLIASRQQCQQALEFMAKGGSILVHCAAGISRSTGIVLGYLLSLSNDYREAIDKLYAIRSCASPNTHILQLMCKILEMEELLPQIHEYIGHKRAEVDGDN